MKNTFLIGQDVTLNHVLRIAQLADFAPWPDSKKPFLTEGMLHRNVFPEQLSVLSGSLSEENLLHLMNAPISSVIDANALDDSIVNFAVQHTHTDDLEVLGLLMTCPIIYACDIARIFTTALQKRLFFSKTLAESIHLALHESIVNGLIHGNLQLSSNLRQSARDFIEYAHLLNERLNDPTYAQKSMSLWASWNDERLEIKIKDEGAGYTSVPTVQRTDQPAPQAKSGRGLRLIAGIADSCTIDDFGREVTLSFLLHDRIEHPVAAESMAEDRYESDTPMDDPDLSQCRVLVMEDNPSNQAVLTRLLNVAGITQIQLAADGIEGLHKVLSFKPDLIILDITMPRMNGQEVLYHLKSAPETKHIPVLVQTASDTREMREKAFSSGATDFITKPINPLEFFARVKVHLENRILIYNLRHQLDQIETEMQSARRMQVDMLPHPDHIAEFGKQFHIKFAQYFEPSSMLGGDYWQMFPIRGELLGIYLCDFSGHGVASALNTFRLHGIIAQMDKKKINSPAEFLKTLNSRLFDLLPRGQFATFFFGIYDPKKRTLHYAGADAPSPFWHSGRKTKLLDTSGIPLGIMREASYAEHTIQMAPGDTLFLYSDALTESPSVNGERLGEVGFKKIVDKYVKNPNVQVALREIMNAFFEFAPPPPPDDVTSILLRISDK
ncbi:MAG: SpoIIE family protein phosphatase [Alphaproteobacteria bacterium]|nr:SpoIIE family protein phosphatase [Alphaproteobacteria bacterium]